MTTKEPEKRKDWQAGIRKMLFGEPNDSKNVKGNTGVFEDKPSAPRTRTRTWECESNYLMN